MDGAKLLNSIDPLYVIEKYYQAGTPLYETLMIHSTKVRDKALECIDRLGLEVDRDFVAEAAMLHDVGIFRCDASDIYCTGRLPYIAHGVEGRKILEKEGLPMHAIDDIDRQHLPLPRRDMLPISIEEKLICYADKFFSKSGDPREEKSLDRVVRSMQRHGPETLARFMELHRMFG